jgi:hypothetical protein
MVNFVRLWDSHFWLSALSFGAAIGRTPNQRSTPLHRARCFLTGDVEGYYYRGAESWQGHSGVLESRLREARLAWEMGVRCSLTQESAGLGLRKPASVARRYQGLGRGLLCRLACC